MFVPIIVPLPMVFVFLVIYRGNGEDKEEANGLEEFQVRKTTSHIRIPPDQLHRANMMQWAPMRLFQGGVPLRVYTASGVVWVCGARARSEIGTPFPDYFQKISITVDPKQI